MTHIEGTGVPNFQQVTDIGIATTNNIVIGSTGSWNPILTVMRRTDDGGPILNIGNPGNGSTNFYFSRNNVTGELSIQGNQTGANNIVLAPVAGRVGIGTTAPLSPLFVQQTQNNSATQYTDNDIGVYIYNSNATAGTFAVLKMTSASVGASNAEIIFGGTSASDLFRIEPRITPGVGAGISMLGNGKVGIGMTSPVVSLHISGVSSLSSGLEIDITTAGLSKTTTGSYMPVIMNGSKFYFLLYS